MSQVDPVWRSRRRPSPAGSKVRVRPSTVVLDHQHRLAVVQEVHLLDAHVARLVDRRDPVAWPPSGADLAQWHAVAGEVGFPSLGAHAQALRGARRARPVSIAATAGDQERESEKRPEGSHAPDPLA
jgi:hypothetical protein